MKDLVNEIEAAPYKYKTAYIVAETSSFFSFWRVEYKNISRNIPTVIRKWGNDIEKAINHAETADVPSLRLSQCAFYSLAVFARYYK